MMPFAIQYRYRGEIFGTVIMAGSRGEAEWLFKRQNPHVEFIKIVD